MNTETTSIIGVPPGTEGGWTWDPTQGCNVPADHDTESDPCAGPACETEPDPMDPPVGPDDRPAEPDPTWDDWT